MSVLWGYSLNLRCSQRTDGNLLYLTGVLNKKWLGWKKKQGCGKEIVVEKSWFKWFLHFAKGASRGASTKRQSSPDWLVKKDLEVDPSSLFFFFYSHLFREIYQSLLCLFEQRRRSSRCNLPVHALCLVQESAVLVQQRAVRLKNNDIVNHQSCQHDHHLELIVYPQEHGAGD